MRLRRLCVAGTPAAVGSTFAVLGAGPIDAVVLGLIGGLAVWGFRAIVSGTIL